MIVYLPASGWSDSSHDSKNYQLYANETFHSSEQLVCSAFGRFIPCTVHDDIKGANATLTFNGSAVYLYGSRRANHVRIFGIELFLAIRFGSLTLRITRGLNNYFQGMYAVTLDGQTTVANGQPVTHDQDMFQTLLYSKTGLDDTQHEVQIGRAHV